MLSLSSLTIFFPVKNLPGTFQKTIVQGISQKKSHVPLPLPPAIAIFFFPDNTLFSFSRYWAWRTDGRKDGYLRTKFSKVKSSAPVTNYVVQRGSNV